MSPFTRMWRQPFRPTFFQQSTSRILQCNIVFKCISNTNVRCATFLPSLPLKQKTLNSETAGAHKQNVIKKVESPTEGRKLLQIYPPPSMINCQTILLPGSEKIRASAVVEHPEKFIDSLSNDTQTVCDAVMTGLLKSSTGKCLGFRMPPKVGEYNWITYAEAVEKKNFIGSGLVNLGLEPSQKTMVGICTKTRPEFVLSMLACSHFSMVLVPLYHCFGMEAISQIIQQVEMEAVICETSELANDIIKNGVKYPMLKHIILMEEDEGELAKSCDKYNILSFRELEENGQRYPRSPVKPKPDDTFCICYTSGTTGEPKGVIVSHRNVLSCIGALDTVLGDAISKDSSLMCYLPCAHIYEIINEIFCLYHGGRLGFYSGTTEDLLSDIKKFQPNVVPLVPKLMNIIYSAVRKQIGPHPIKRSLFRFAIQQKKKQLKRGVVSKTSIWDAIFFSKIQEQLGGRVQMIFSSSAPVCKEIMQFFRSSMGCLVFEIYGLSEVGACTMTLMSEDDSGFVGAPLPCNHVKLVSIPELDYYAEDNVGEICIRGANVFKGYFKNPTATKEVLDKDGWYHTGDIGMWLPNGTLSIIDRKKHIFKMSQGEYIIPEKSEGVYMQSPIVSQIFVDGDPNQDFTVGIMVPDRNLFMQWTKRKGFPETDFENLCNDKRVKQEVLMHLSKLGKKRGLKSLHQVGNIYLCSEPFSQDNGLLTPTLKLKRSNARKAFENIFNDLYEEGNLRKMYDV